MFPDPMRLALRHASEAALAFLDGLDSTPVAALRDGAALRAALGGDMPEKGAPATEVVRHLVAGAAGGIVGSAGGRFYGWVIGGALPSALAADWLVSAWDQNAASHACGPAAAIVEEICATWIKQLLGLSASVSFALTTGCQAAHLTCLLAARHHLLSARGWDVEKLGLHEAPPIRVLTSEHRHMSVERACRMIGLGSKAIELLRSGADGRLDPSDLVKALHGDRPAIVVLQAGDLNIGAFDEFAILIPIAHKAGAWVHVDGAFGMWLRADPRRRRLPDGVEAADSWAIDGHKWLNIPYDNGLALVAHPEAHRAALQTSAAYLITAHDGRDAMDWTPEWSRRARGFPLYAALRELGREGLADLLDRTCRHAHAIVTGIGALPGAELVAEPVINQGLVRFLDERMTANEAAHDVRTEKVIAAINAGGEAFFTPTTWRGRRVMRVSVCNWRTSEADVARVVAAARRAIAEAAQDPGR